MTKRFLSLLLALSLIFTLGISAFAEKTGKITIQNSSKNRTYTIYKVFDATYSGNLVAYKLVSGTTLEKDNGFFLCDAKGNVDATASATDATKENLTPEAIAFLKSFTDQYKGVLEIKSQKGNGKNLEFDVDPGYYFVDSGAAVSVGTANPNAVIYDKNEDKPGPAPESPTDKENPSYRPFKALISDDGVKTNTTVEAGKSLQFVVAFEAVNFAKTGTDYNTITDYVIEDIPTNLTIDWNSVEVKVDGENAPYTTGTNTVTISWTDVNGSSLYDSPAIVEIKYSSKMPVGTATNSVKISYHDCDGNSYDVPNNDDSGNPDVKLSNYKVTVDPQDKDGEGSLTGGEYKLYKTDTNGTKWYYTETDDVVSWTTDSDAAKVGTEFEGLEDGTYNVEEVNAPKGYNNVEDQPVTIDGSDETVTIGYGKGIRLPSTGGIGTKMFYVFGSILLVAAGVLLIVKKRMSAQG